MNPLDLLFGQVANTIRQHASPNTPGPSYDANPLLGALGSLFGQHAQQSGGSFGGFDPSQIFGGGGQNSNQGGMGNPISSDQDPYGDPGLQGGGGFNQSNVASSDQDPYGDPGLQR